MNLSYIFLLFIIYSFLGWLMEVVLKLIIDKKFINRGFLIGPYCPIYGVGLLSVTYLLKNYLDEWIILFFMSMIICSFVEYITSYILEKLFHTSWWDYSDNKYNINGRICLETTAPFGLGCMFIMYIVNPFLYKILDSIPLNTLNILGVFIGMIFIIDIIISLRIIIKFSKISSTTRMDNTEKITKYVKKTIIKKGKSLYIRFIDAFPRMKIFKVKKK